ncbi:MAG: hypothetical protein CM1200mP41_20320 [Gammaproteobacteria bacterium]|nr:MAG: hypothetical protein CM1200mP41_20320 [Gammaproteobacteria bacterium]
MEYRWARALITCAGFVLLLSPLALWVAWSQAIFIGGALYHGRYYCGGHDIELGRVDIANSINMATPAVDMRQVHG